MARLSGVYVRWLWCLKAIHGRYPLIQSGLDRQTLRDWVHRHNEGGIAALASGKSTGRGPKLNAAEMARLNDLVVIGPDPEIDGVVRSRCIRSTGSDCAPFFGGGAGTHSCQMAVPVALDTAATTALSSPAGPGRGRRNLRKLSPPGARSLARFS